MNPEEIRHLVDPTSYKEYFENPYRTKWHSTMIHDITAFHKITDPDPVVYDLGMGFGCGNYLYYRRAGLGKPIEIYIICHPEDEKEFCKGYRRLEILKKNIAKSGLFKTTTNLLEISSCMGMLNQQE